MATTQTQGRIATEFVRTLAEPELPGFKPKPIDSLSRYSKPVTLSSMEVSRLNRSTLRESVTGFPTLEYRLWLEAGKRVPPNPKKRDANYNGNVWRNFRETFGLEYTGETQDVERKISDDVAAIYPLNIPKPSSMGPKSYSQFLQSSGLFHDDRHKVDATRRSRIDEHTMQRLRVLTESRNPPLDDRGYILPPDGFKAYKPLFLEHPDPEAVTPLITTDMEPDLFGNLVKKKPRPRLWKLTYRSNNPKYKKAIQFAEDLRTQPKQFKPGVAMSWGQQHQTVRH